MIICDYDYSTSNQTQTVTDYYDDISQYDTTPSVLDVYDNIYYLCSKEEIDDLHLDDDLFLTFAVDDYKITPIPRQVIIKRLWIYIKTQPRAPPKFVGK